MKKTVFFRSFTILFTLLPMTILEMVLVAIVGYGQHLFTASALPFLEYLGMLFSFLWWLLLIMFLCTALPCVIFIIWNFCDRLKNDSLLNFFVSCQATLAFRAWLKKEELNPKETISSNLNVLNANQRTIRLFNKAVTSSIIDISDGSITVYLKIPSTAESEKLLRSMQEQIRTYLAREFDDYTFSSIVDNKKWAFCEGTRKLK